MLKNIKQDTKVQVDEPVVTFAILKEILEDINSKDLIVCYIHLLQSYNKERNEYSFNMDELEKCGINQTKIWECINKLVGLGLIENSKEELNIVNEIICVKTNKKLVARRKDYGLLYDFEVRCIFQYYQNKPHVLKDCLLLLALIRLRLGVKRTGINNILSYKLKEKDIKMLGTDENHIMRLFSILVDLGILHIPENDISQFPHTVTYKQTTFAFLYKLECQKKIWGISFFLLNVSFLDRKRISNNKILRKTKREHLIKQKYQIVPTYTGNVARIPCYWFFDLELTEYRIPFYVYMFFLAKKATRKKIKTLVYSPNQIATAIGYTSGNINRKLAGMNMYEKLKVMMNAYYAKGYMLNFNSKKFVANKIQESYFDFSVIKPKSKFIPMFDFEYDFFIKYAPNTAGLTSTVLMSIFLYIRNQILMHNLTEGQIKNYALLTYTQIARVLNIRNITVSKAVDFLEGSGFIKTFRRSCLKKSDGKWETFPVIFVMQYEMEIGNNIFYPKKHYSCNTFLEIAKCEIGVYSKWNP